MRVLRPFLAAAVTAAALLGAAVPAMAAAPANDTVDGATVISALPFTDTADTTEATTDATDAALNAGCGAPATEASVWYAFTPATDGAVIVDVSQSSYSAGVLLATGSPGNLQLVNCGPLAVIQQTFAGQTLYIMAIDDTPGAGNGGTLKISVTEAPPPPQLALTVDPIGHFDARTGAATLTGTVSCSGGDFVDIQSQLSQNVGRFTIRGIGFQELGCNGTQRWSATIFPDNGKFAGGKAASFTFSFACGPVFCSDTFVEQKVTLRR